MKKNKDHDDPNPQTFIGQLIVYGILFLYIVIAFLLAIAIAELFNL